MGIGAHIRQARPVVELVVAHRRRIHAQQGKRIDGGLPQAGIGHRVALKAVACVEQQQLRVNNSLCIHRSGQPGQATHRTTRSLTFTKCCVPVVHRKQRHPPGNRTRRHGRPTTEQTREHQQSSLHAPPGVPPRSVVMRGAQPYPNGGQGARHLGDQAGAYREPVSRVAQ